MYNPGKGQQTPGADFNALLLSEKFGFQVI